VSTGLAGIDESAVSRAADDGAVGVMNASVRIVTEIATNAPVNRLSTEMLPSVRAS
jgi:hypothetical protein